MEKKKNTSLSLKQKLIILDCLESGQKRKDICKKFSCNVSTISRIHKNREQLREIAGQRNLNNKRLRNSNYVQVDKELLKWVQEIRTTNESISGPIILEKAQEIANLLEIKFEANEGWLDRWKKRNNISFKKTYGEIYSADITATEDWTSHVLPNLLNNYTAENIFNADESALLYKVLPYMTQQKEIFKSKKMLKDKLTLLFLTNATGTFKEIFAIGYVKNPWCIRGCKELPIKYFSNKKAWMTYQIWSKIIEEIDLQMQKANRKILLFIDNAVCHKLDDGVKLKNINIQFLSENTKSFIQPLNNGIIKNFKIQYRKILLRKQLIILENELSKKDFCKSIDLLQALKFIKKAWCSVHSTTIINSFKKTDFLSDSIKYILFQTEKCNEIEENSKIYFADDNLPCFDDTIEEETINEIMEETDESDVESDIEIINETEENNLSRRDVFNALTTLQKYFVKNIKASELIDILEEEFINSSNIKLQKTV